MKAIVIVIFVLFISFIPLSFAEQIIIEEDFHHLGDGTNDDFINPQPLLLPI